MAKKKQRDKASNRPKNEAGDRSRDQSASARSQEESGLPGGGRGRRDEVGQSGVYPASGGEAPADAELRGMASWGQGTRGAEGYDDSGGSELVARDGELLGGLDVGPSGAPTPNLPQKRSEQHASEPEQHAEDESEQRRQQ